MDETSIIKQIQGGARDEYRHLVSSYKNLIYSIIIKQVGSHEVAEDLAQDTFLKAYKNIQGFRFESKFSTWLTRIALNLTSNYFKSKAYRNVRQNVLADDLHLEALNNPAEELERKKQLTQLSECLAKLSERFRTALLLTSLEGKEYQEVSEILQVPIGTIRSRLNRARLLLSKCMQL